MRQALDDLGIDEARCNELGLRLFKLGCTWPIVPAELRAFARGLDLIIVVEEKRSLIEVQVREELYGSPTQPVCIGKHDEDGDWLFPVKGALDPNDIGDRDRRAAAEVPSTTTSLRARVGAAAHARRRALAEIKQEATRTPYFCSGCPHNRSTVIPEGARAYAGIGCHFMAQYMDRGTDGYTQMGGEGANWVGEAHFSKRGHVFQNLGDGTYNHSGALALRWAIDSKVNVTYKILFNDAVAMTGGQRHEGGLTVPQIARQVAADGAQAHRRRHRRARQISAGHAMAGGRRRIRPRDELIAVEKELSEDRRRDGADLRPDLRGGEAPPPQARRVSRSRQARLHQRTRLRRLRRLRRQIQLRVDPADGDRIRPQARRSTNRAATRIFPASTASARRSSPCTARSRARRARPRPTPPPVAGAGAAAS